jgi:hypothetical protein
MADVGTFTGWSSTAASNSPSGTTAVATGLDDNLREIQAQVAAWRDGTGYGVLTVTSVAGTNTITGSTSPAPTLAANQKFLLIPAATNTGATTLNLNSGGAKNIFAGNTALVGGELHANIPVLLEYDGTQFQALGPVFKQPTRQVFTSGSGTYTTPTGTTRIYVRLVGGGAGGGAQNTNNGSNGGNTTFGTLTGSGGSGPSNGGSQGGTGGSASGGDVNLTGGQGQSGFVNALAGVQPTGGQGGGSVFGSGGAGGTSGSGGVVATSTGTGGGGGGGDSGTAAGAGGGAGGYVEKWFTAPSGTYSYAVGAAGNGGAAGGRSGGNGAAGIIIVDEFYN